MQSRNMSPVRRAGRPHRLALALLVLMALGGAQAAAAGVGLTLSTNTFLPLGAPEYTPVPAGMYGRAGIAWLPGSRLELELCHIPRLTPGFYSQVFFGISAGWWLLERRQTGYFNMVVDAACLYGLDDTWLVGLRLSPLVLGGPQYRTAERVFTVGLLFDPRRSRLLVQFQLIAITFFL